MDAKTIQAIRSDPRVFRDHLMVDTDDGPRRLSDVMDPWQRADFEALDNGLRLAVGLPVDPSRPTYSRALLERGRGHSKTTDLATLGANAIIAPTRPVTGIWAAADTDQARFGIEAFGRLTAVNPWLAAILDVQTNRVRHRTTGSELRIISSDAGSSYGALCDFIVVDELTHWKANGDQLWHSLLSTAAKRKRCLLCGIQNAGTGQGTSWQWKVREQFRESPTCYFHSLDGPQASWISAASLDEQRRMLPGPAFDRLWLNRWTSGEGDCLTEADIAASLVLPGPTREYQDGWGYAAGVDLGLAKDCSAVVVIGKNFYNPEAPINTLRVCEVKAWKPRPGHRVRVEEIEQHILDVHRRFNLACISFDPWQSEYLTQRLADAGLPCLQTPMVPKNLQAMATTLTEAFSERAIQLFDDPVLLSDLRALRVVEKNYGWRIDPVRNADGHGDRAMAAALGVLAARMTTFDYTSLYGDGGFSIGGNLCQGWMT